MILLKMTRVRSKKMYSVIMKNGKIINVDANSQDMLF